MLGKVRSRSTPSTVAGRELPVGLVQEDEDVARDCTGERDELGGRELATGRIVGVADEYRAGLRGHRRRHCTQIVPMFGIECDGDTARPGDSDQYRVRLVAAPRVDDLGARTRVRSQYLLEQCQRTGADQYLVVADAQAAAQPSDQRVAEQRRIQVRV